MSEESRMSFRPPAFLIQLAQPIRKDAEVLMKLLITFGEKLSVWYLKAFLILASIGVVLGSSIAFYWLIYFAVVPKKVHTYQASLESPQCLNISLSTHQWHGSKPLHYDRPTGGMDYDVTLTMSVPLTSNNIRLGQILTEAKLITQSGNMHAQVHTQTVIPQLSKWALLVRELTFAVPTGLNLFMKDAIDLDILLFDGLPIPREPMHEDHDHLVVHKHQKYDPISRVQVCMHAFPTFYSAELAFTAKLTGLRYVLSHYPLGAFAFFVATMTWLFLLFAVGAGISVLLWRKYRLEEVAAASEESSSEGASEEIQSVEEAEAAPLTDRLPLESSQEQDAPSSSSEPQVELVNNEDVDPIRVETKQEEEPAKVTLMRDPPTPPRRGRLRRQEVEYSD